MYKCFFADDFFRIIAIRSVAIFTVITLIGTEQCIAQKASARTEPAFAHLTINEGLSQNTVFCIFQDRRGFIWIGTEDGLNRYDGYEFKVFKNDPDNPESIRNNQVNVITEDVNGKLVVGTAGGLSFYNPGTESFSNVLISSPSKNVQSANFVTAIVPANNALYIGTYDGLKLYDPGTGKFRHNAATNRLNNLNIQALYKDKRNVLWVGLRNRMACVDLGTLHYKAVPEVLQRSFAENPGNVRVIKQDIQGNLWFGTEQSGLFYYKVLEDKCITYKYRPNDPFSLPVNVVRDVFFENNERVWVATRKGVSILNPTTHRFTTYTHERYNQRSLSHHSVLKIMKDRSGSIWIGTYAGGLNIYNPESVTFSNISEQIANMPGLNNAVVSSIVPGKNAALWIGTEGGGLNYVDRASGRYAFYSLKARGSQLSEDIVKALAKDIRGNLWVGAFDGLYYFDVSKKAFTNHTLKGEKDFRGRSQVYAVLADSDGVWAGTNGGGLIYFHPAKAAKIYTHHAGSENSIIGNNVSALARDKSGNIWIGTLQGLCYFDKKAERFFRYGVGSKKSTLSNTIITSLFIDSRNRLWVGTRGGGLNLLDPASQKFYSFTEKDGLSNNVVRGINEDLMGNIWVSSNKGISMLQFSAHSKMFVPKLKSVKNYSVTDGLQSNQYLSNSTLRLSTGELLFGGINGISAFLPGEIKSNRIIPQVQFIDFLINSKRVPIGTADSPSQIHINESRNITLKYDQAYVTFKFAALNFTNSAKNQYAYKLEGFKKDDWHYVGNQRTATYTNLDAGNYVFMVKASNNDGIWNEKPATILIRVLPPWYKTWWAYLLYASIFLVLLYFFYRTAKLENALEFEQMSHEKDKELAQRKLAFFTHISHEIKTPLTLILSPIEKLLNQSSLDNKVQNQLSLVYRNGERLMRLTNQLLDYRKFDTGNMQLQAAEGNIVRFAREVIAAFDMYARSRGVEIKLISSKKSIRVWFDRDMMEKIFFNLISNALKFTAPGGHIHINLDTIRASDGIREYVIIRVEDNGIGIPKENIRSVFDQFQHFNTQGVNSGGTGLGLSLTKGLVELHHGTIEVKSLPAVEENRGLTSFTIHIPLGNAHFKSAEISLNYNSSEDLKSYQSTEIVAISEKTLEKKQRVLRANGEQKPIVLIVEDNPEVLQFIESHFADDFDVHTAVDGEAGWSASIEIMPDIVISDVMMPNLTGTELCTRLKSDMRTSHIPVILLTAREPMLYKIEGLETGADDYITKPFNSHYLELKVLNLIESRMKLRERYSREVTLQPTNIAITSVDEKFLDKAMKHVEDNISASDLGVEELSKFVGMSKTTLYRKIKALTNQNTNEFIRTIRLKRACQLLSSGKFTVSEVAYQVGFTSPDYFRKCFKEQFGRTPSEFAEEAFTKSK